MYKKKLLQTKKLLLGAVLASTLTTTACSFQEKDNITVYAYKEIDEGMYSNPIAMTFTDKESLHEFLEQYYTVDDSDSKGHIIYGNDYTIIEEKPIGIIDKDGNEVYMVPSGYSLSLDEYGNKVSRKVIKR